MRVLLQVWASVLAVCVCARAYEFICMYDYNITDECHIRETP